MKADAEEEDCNNNRNVDAHKNNHKRKRGRQEENKHQQKNQSSNKSNNNQKMKGKKEVAIFGNYRNYYGYRVGRELEEDPRLKVLKREWFEGKDCLDIGCNSGVITIAIARKFGCRSILGIDIDGARIRDADWTLRNVVRAMMPKKTSKVHGSADAELVNGSENAAAESVTKVTRDSSTESPQLVDRDLFAVVSFQKGNFVQNWHPPANAAYDVILCLSVTKWVHLNWGDDGLITLFWRVWKFLRPGGVFILEPQPWSSYHSNRQVSETASANYKSIEISPEDFQDVLLDKIGFRKVENLTSSLSGTKTGFNRPLLAFWK